MSDRTLTCLDCGNEFIFTDSEQDFYKEKGFEHDPKRCPDCRKNRKDKSRGSRPSGGRGGMGGGRGFGGEKKSFDVVCSACGANTTVPFKPKSSAPVYCRTCFEKQKSH